MTRQWIRSFGMLKLALVVVPLLVAATANAQTQRQPSARSTEPKVQPVTKQEQLVQRVFAIKHADVEAIARTLRIFTMYLEPNRELRVIGIKAPAALMPNIEDTIRRLDVPPPTPQNVELTVYLLLGSDQEGSVASELEGIVKQLKATFGFKGFRAVDTLVVRSRDTRPGQVDGLSRLDPDVPNLSTYHFGYSGATISSDEKGRSIRLNGLQFSANIVAKKQQVDGGAIATFESYNAGFRTDVDVREGQKVVVGKAAIGGTNSALILVITTKILE